MIQFANDEHTLVICPQCKETKDIRDFNVDRSKAIGIRNRCKKCHSANNTPKTRAKYRESKEYRTSRSNMQKKYYATKKPQTRKYFTKKRFLDLFGGKCSICGYSECQACLEFHHTDMSDVEFKIATININDKSFDKAFKEASKCVLVCNRCHREIHNKNNEEIYKNLNKENNWMY